MTYADLERVSLQPADSDLFKEAEVCEIVSQSLNAGLSRRSAVSGLIAAAALGATGTAPASASLVRRPSDNDRTQLVLLGTAGGPRWYAGSDRAGISSAVVQGDRYYLVDAGHGVGPQLRDAGLGGAGGPLAGLRAVFLTHLHSDHVIDLNNLLVEGIGNGLEHVDRPVQIWGPGNRGAVPPLFGLRPRRR